MTDEDEARKALQEAIEKSKDKECKGETCVISAKGRTSAEERKSK